MRCAACGADKVAAEFSKNQRKRAVADRKCTGCTANASTGADGANAEPAHLLPNSVLFRLADGRWAEGSNKRMARLKQGRLRRQHASLRATKEAERPREPTYTPRRPRTGVDAVREAERLRRAEIGATARNTSHALVPFAWRRVLARNDNDKHCGAGTTDRPVPSTRITTASMRDKLPTRRWSARRATLDGHSTRLHNPDTAVAPHTPDTGAPSAHVLTNLTKDKMAIDTDNNQEIIRDLVAHGEPHVDRDHDPDVDHHVFPVEVRVPGRQNKMQIFRLGDVLDQVGVPAREQSACRWEWRRGASGWCLDVISTAKGGGEGAGRDSGMTAPVPYAWADLVQLPMLGQGTFGTIRLLRKGTVLKMPIVISANVDKKALTATAAKMRRELKVTTLLAGPNIVTVVKDCCGTFSNACTADGSGTASGGASDAVDMPVLAMEQCGFQPCWAETPAASLMDWVMLAATARFNDGQGGKGANPADFSSSGCTLADGLVLALGAAEGLQWLHSKNWVHADVKPENVLIRDDGSPSGKAVLSDLATAFSLIGAASIPNGLRSESGESRAREMMSRASRCTEALSFRSSVFYTDPRLYGQMEFWKTLSWPDLFDDPEPMKMPTCPYDKHSDVWGLAIVVSMLLGQQMGHFDVVVIPGSGGRPVRETTTHHADGGATLMKTMATNLKFKHSHPHLMVYSAEHRRCATVATLKCAETVEAVLSRWHGKVVEQRPVVGALVDVLRAAVAGRPPPAPAWPSSACSAGSACSALRRRSAYTCRGTWARVTIDRFRHLAL